MISHMLLLRETVLTPEGNLEIELHDDLRYRLRWRGVTYSNMSESDPHYRFRSVEQLRYDFERDAKG
jgi:hypothetical protein